MKKFILGIVLIFPILLNSFFLHDDLPPDDSTEIEEKIILELPEDQKKIAIDFLSNLDSYYDLEENYSLKYKQEKKEDIKKILKNLIDQNINHNILNISLISSAKRAHPEIVKLLLDNGANVNYLDNKENSALIVALNKLPKPESFEVIKELFKKNPKLDIKNKKGQTFISLVDKLKPTQQKQIHEIFYKIHGKSIREPSALPNDIIRLIIKKYFIPSQEESPIE